MDIRLDETKSILFIKPAGPLESTNFSQIASVIDAYIQKNGMLKGLVIETKSFPGWKNFDGFTSHMKFIKNHQAKVKKIALVTDNMLANIAPVVVSLFLKPEVKHFPFGQEAAALQWIETP